VADIIAVALNAPPRRATAPQGAIEGRNDGGRLKLRLAEKQSRPYGW
jgi:hypothetical protein